MFRQLDFIIVAGIINVKSTLGSDQPGHLACGDLSRRLSGAHRASFQTSHLCALAYPRRLENKNTNRGKSRGYGEIECARLGSKCLPAREDVGFKS